MNTQKQVFNKLFSNEKVELASQNYEFAKQASDVAKEAQKIQDNLVKASLKMNDMKMAYIKMYMDFQTLIDQSVALNNGSANDLKEIEDSLKAIGMDPKEAQKITGFSKASEIVKANADYAKKYKTLYTKI
jgi:hypothetical protein